MHPSLLGRLGLVRAWRTHLCREDCSLLSLCLRHSASLAPDMKKVSFPPKLASSCCLPLPEDISSCPVLSPCGSRSLLGDQNPAYPSGVLLMMLLHGASCVSANGATFIHLFHESLNSQLSVRGSVSHLSLSVGSTLLTPPQHPR